MDWSLIAFGISVVALIVSIYQTYSTQKKFDDMKKMIRDYQEEEEE